MIKTPEILLVSPKGSANVGGIARLMGNFGLSQMRVVEPRCELFSKEARMMGLKNHEILKSAKVYSDFSSSVADLNWTVALSMRPGSQRSPFIRLDQLFTRPEWSPPPGESWAFVFGREDNGLEVEELRRCRLEVGIPTIENKPSLNLTSAAGIVLFHYFQKLCLVPEIRDRESLPKQIDEEIFFGAVGRLLKEIEFMKAGEMDRMLLDLRDIYRRARVNRRELRILFGILSDLERRLGSRLIERVPPSASEDNFCHQPVRAS